MPFEPKSLEQKTRAGERPVHLISVASALVLNSFQAAGGVPTCPETVRLEELAPFSDGFGGFRSRAVAGQAPHRLPWHARLGKDLGEALEVAGTLRTRLGARAIKEIKTMRGKLSWIASLMMGSAFYISSPLAAAPMAFTWDPAAAAPALAGPGSAFTADTILTTNFLRDVAQP